MNDIRAQNIGIVGDGARVEGGIHFHAPSLPTPPLSVDHIPTLPHPPAPLKPASGSPFIVGRPLRASEPIFGREPAFRFIAGELAKFSSVNIVGERRMGKTSLLNHLVDCQDEHLVPQPDHPPLVLARLDLQASITSQVWFYGTGLRELLDNLPPSRSGEARAFEDQRTGLHARPRADYHQFERALRRLRDPRGLCVRPVLIVDEFERLLAPAAEKGFPFPDFFNTVRALITADLLAMIVASRRPLADYFHHPDRPDTLTSTFPNYFTLFTLRPLDEQAADALLLQPSNHRLTVQETAQAKRWAGGHPCHLQAAGQACYEAQAGGHAPTWARERFDELESQSCMTGQVAGKESRLGRLWRVLRCAPRAIFLDFFIAIGRLAQHLGARFDDVAAWLIGAAIILILLLLLFGVAKGSDLLDIIKQGLGL